MEKHDSRQLSSAEAIAHPRAAKLASPVAMATPILKIATFHSSSLGALAAVLPALVALRDSFPGARICSFVRGPLLPLLQNFSAVDEAHLRPGGGISAQAALMARLHGGDYDLALSFSQSSNALLLAWATGSPIRAGFVPARMDALLTHKTTKTGPLRSIEALELVRAIGATPRGENARDWLSLPFENTERATRLRQSGGINGDYLVVSTQGRRRGENKNLHEAEVEPAMLRQLAGRFSLVVVGLKNSAVLLRDTGHTSFPVLDLGGKTDVLTLAALCAASRGVFGVGHGPLQLGKLFEKPCVSLSDSHSADFSQSAERALQVFGF